MKTHPPRKSAAWPRKVRLGRVTVTVYRRQAPGGYPCFMVANYANGKRRFDSYSTEAHALEAAAKLTRQLSEHDVVAAYMTNGQAADYAAALQTLAPFNVSLPTAASTLAECLKLVSDLPNLHAAAKFYAVRHKAVTHRPVAGVVAELLSVKEKRRASARYLQDLRFRLGRFAADFHKDTCNITPAEIQAWLDCQKLAPQSYTNFRRVLHALFEFAVARDFAYDNPVAATESVRVNGGKVEIFTPSELSRLFAAASPDSLPCLAVGAFAGLRSAEIERLEWSDVHIAERCIVVGADKAKTASRRVVPVCDALVAWLAPYADRQGKVWPGSHEDFYKAQHNTAAATKSDGKTAVRWKPNALRHSYASYRFAQIGDAGRVAGELGNSAAVVHRHYRELVKPAEAERWFSIRPEAPANVLPMAATAVATT